MFSHLDMVVDTSTVELLEVATHALQNLKKPLSVFRRGLEHRINDQLFQTKASGGSVRGVLWPSLAPQYTRKDGTVVQAWGGVAKVRGKGTVKGRKRHGSAGRVAQGKRFLDPWTGRSLMRYASMNNYQMRLTTTRAKHIAIFASKRQFLFWNDADQAELPKILQVWIDRHIEKARGHATGK